MRWFSFSEAWKLSLIVVCFAFICIVIQGVERQRRVFREGETSHAIRLHNQSAPMRNFELVNIGDASYEPKKPKIWLPITLPRNASRTYVDLSPLVWEERIPHRPWISYCGSMRNRTSCEFNSAVTSELSGAPKILVIGFEPAGFHYFQGNCSRPFGHAGIGRGFAARVNRMASRARRERRRAVSTTERMSA